MEKTIHKSIKTWEATMKIKKIVKFLLIGISLLCLTACAGTLNPYQGEFECPQAEKGKCVSIQQAYQESIISFDDKKKTKKTTGKEEPLYNEIETKYTTELFGKLSSLLKEPKSPLVVPPKVVRVMILPYQSGEGKEFYSARYVYVIVEEPRWILQNLKTLPPEEQWETENR